MTTSMELIGEEREIQQVPRVQTATSLTAQKITTRPTRSPTRRPNTKAPTKRPTVRPNTKAPTKYPTEITVPQARKCNGLASNCNQRVNDIVYASVHNAMSTKADNFAGYNNIYSLEDALTAGFRALQIDVCDCGFCHRSCISGSRSAVGVSTGIVNLMKQHVNEVVIIELQVTDSKNAFLWGNWNKMVSVSGFKDLIYKHTNQQQAWPTLGELINANKLLITFQHDGGNCNVVGVCPPLIHNTFDYMWETPFDLTGAAELENYSLSCVVLRGPTNAAFGVSNHFTHGSSSGLSSEAVASVVNTRLQVQNRVNACNKVLPSHVNFIAVNFWNIAGTLQVVQAYNAGQSSK